MNILSKAGRDWRAFLPVLLSLPLLMYLGNLLRASSADFTGKIMQFYQSVGQAFWNSILLALVMTACATIFGMILYGCYVSLPFSLRPFLILFSLLPLSYPPLVWHPHWMTRLALLHGSSAGRMIWEANQELILSVYNSRCWFHSCAVLLPTDLSFAGIKWTAHQKSGGECPSVHESEAAPVQSSSASVPDSSPARCNSSVLCGIHSVEVPSLLQVKVYPLEIYTRFSSLLDEEQGVLLCLPFILFLPLWWWIIQKSKSLSLQGIRTHSYVLQSLLLRSMFISLSGLILMVTVLFPLLALFAHARYGLFFTELIQRQGERTLHSIIYAFGGASLIVILALLYSADFQQRKWAVPVLFFLFCLPGILIASAWLQFRSHWIGRIPPFIQIITILLAYSLKYFVFGYIASLFLWQQYGFRTREVDTLLALGLWQKIRFIYLPSFWRRSRRSALSVFSGRMWGSEFCCIPRLGYLIH